MMTGNPILSDAAMRAQQLEAQYSRKLKDLRQAKEDELAQVDERHKIIKTSYRMERIRIKEDFSLRRLNLKTQIERLKDQRGNLRHALSVQDEMIDSSDNAMLEDFTSRIEALHKQVIGLERQMASALNDAEAAFDNRRTRRNAGPSTSTTSTRLMSFISSTWQPSSRTARHASKRKEVLRYEYV